MWSDLVLQAAIILFTLFMFLYIHKIPQKLLPKLRRSNLDARRHFVLGAQLLSQARSSTSDAVSLAGRAEAEANRAIALDPKDAASHILRALALDLQGLRTSALVSLDAALSPPAVRSLSDAERGDALFKRAELKVALGGGGALQDLVESVKLRGDNERAYGLLGECYEKNGLREEAQKAYEDALRIKPNYDFARDALARKCAIYGKENSCKYFDPKAPELGNLGLALARKRNEESVKKGKSDQDRNKGIVHQPDKEQEKELLDPARRFGFFAFFHASNPFDSLTSLRFASFVGSTRSEISNLRDNLCITLQMIVQCQLGLARPVCFLESERRKSVRGATWVSRPLRLSAPGDLAGERKKECPES
ncbi:tetratricopeptide repeat protein [Striga asiatica]|uniref:Tetratricopeptide repeat protein n=1 Tax=Striga asiatica TaxID=4170 RepID=A0A5A7QS46_STRAF|nr:tetratricopeptide repeat protein [Striga asiatica]